jgi:hypothetical protein
MSKTPLRSEAKTKRRKIKENRDTEPGSPNPKHGITKEKIGHEWR